MSYSLCKLNVTIYSLLRDKLTVFYFQESLRNLFNENDFNRIVMYYYLYGNIVIIEHFFRLINQIFVTNGDKIINWNEFQSSMINFTPPVSENKNIDTILLIPTN